MKATIKFRPTERATLAVLGSTHEGEGRDPVATYSRLLSATALAGAMLGLRPEGIASHFLEVAETATEVVKAHPDIFGWTPEVIKGGKTND